MLTDTKYPRVDEPFFKKYFFGIWETILLTLVYILEMKLFHLAKKWFGLFIGGKGK
jgi:hypothetical protein